MCRRGGRCCEAGFVRRPVYGGFREVLRSWVDRATPRVLGADGPSVVESPEPPVEPGGVPERLLGQPGPGDERRLACEVRPKITDRPPCICQRSLGPSPEGEMPPQVALTHTLPHPHLSRPDTWYAATHPVSGGMACVSQSGSPCSRGSSCAESVRLRPRRCGRIHVPLPDRHSRQDDHRPALPASSEVIRLYP